MKKFLFYVTTFLLQAWIAQASGITENISVAWLMAFYVSLVLHGISLYLLLWKQQ